MGKMRLERQENGGFTLTGGPLTFRDEEDLRATCVQLQRFPQTRFQQDGRPLQSPPYMDIDDENA